MLPDSGVQGWAVPQADAASPFIADLHVHSRYSRACSPNLDLDTFSWWARWKGISLLGTGDFNFAVLRK